MPTDPRQDQLLSLSTRNERIAWSLIAFVIVVSVVLLYLQGRVFWCQAGDLTPWSWDIWSTHNSQHVVDPYAFTHILHGILEFWLLGLFFGRIPLVWRLLIALSIESAWEVAENSAYVIERYREETISLNYFGDSIINSVADIFCCGIGFVLGWKLRFWRSLLLFLLTEVVLIVWIRDSLIINIIMLIWPLEAIKHWQVGN